MNQIPETIRGKDIKQNRTRNFISVAYIILTL